jgi:hypothetical protein
MFIDLQIRIQRAEQRWLNARIRYVDSRREICTRLDT